jgi:8-oxo-dGTP pyrophosphatase MutT (NUDIX family)
MAMVVMLGLVDRAGRVLLQERDEHAPVDPERWTLPGGGVEPGESPEEAAHRELEEETGLVGQPLRRVGDYSLACALHGRDDVTLFTAATSLTDADIDCREGRQIVFVDPAAALGLDLTDASRALLPVVLEAHGAPPGRAVSGPRATP